MLVDLATSFFVFAWQVKTNTLREVTNTVNTHILKAINFVMVSPNITEITTYALIRHLTNAVS